MIDLRLLCLPNAYRYMVKRYQSSVTTRYCLHATNARKRRTRPFWCVMATALLLLVAVTVL